jgi:general secretion pathway protein K
MPRRQKPAERRRCRGVALITVLLVVAIATILAVGMVRSQHMALERAGGLFSQDQAMLYTQGAEDFARELLRQDYDDDKHGNHMVDHPGEAWAQPFPPFPVDGGVVNARITDLQGRFNVNRLWHDNAPDPEAAAIFQRLLRNLDLPQTLVPALTDWLDADGDPSGADGAEDDFYSRLEVPYRAANQPLADISELLLVKGFTPDVVAKLRPHVCALPGSALINVNTADPVVLSALVDGLSMHNAEDVSSQRPAKGYASVDDFLSGSVFNGLDSGEKSSLRSELDVRTHYFRLLTDADIGGRHSVLYAVIARSDSGTLQVVARDFSRKIPALSAAGQNTTTLDAGTPDAVPAASPDSP